MAQKLQSSTRVSTHALKSVLMQRTLTEKVVVITGASSGIGKVTALALGNVPQALTHLSHIDSVIHLSHAEGRDLPIAPPIGSLAHRAERGRA
jgi:hypothetical protein